MHVRIPGRTAFNDKEDGEKLDVQMFLQFTDKKHIVQIANDP